MSFLNAQNALKLALFLAALPCALAQTQGVDTAWAPVTDAELKMTSPVVDKDAGVEALFWRVYVVDQRLGEELERTLYHYVRLKVFNQEGKDRVSTINIRYLGGTVITSVTGRTVKPDGSILDLGKDAVHETVIQKLGGLKWKAVSFAMPGVEAGSIVAVALAPEQAKGAEIQSLTITATARSTTFPRRMKSRNPFNIVSSQ